MIALSRKTASFLILPVLFSCSSSLKNYDPAKKYSRAELQSDLSLLRNILETKHPSLYWYTSKDSMDKCFDRYYQAIGDSMTEQQFGWKILAPLTSNIHCGHTSFGMSRAYNRWADNKRFPGLPLQMKVWNDTMVVTANLNRKDSILKRGTFIKAINGLRAHELTSILFDHMTEDGRADNINYVRLSSNFPYYHRNVFGLSRNYTIAYIDSTGQERTVRVPLFEFPLDSSRKTIRRPPAVSRSKKETRQQRLLSVRSLAIDTAANTAIITLNTFSTGGLRKFFRQTFRYIRKAGIGHVILDLRSNGGGRINLSTLLTRYVTRSRFRVSDTAFAVARSLRPYTRYIKNGLVNNLGLLFFTKKKSDGLYHFGYWERKYYKPKKTNRFTGDLYVLTNGQTFSASSLFCNAVKGQPGITLVGEETGGGWHGNNGILIPDITLPNTRLRVRLPLFRLVQYNHVPKNGSGVVPDIHIGTSYDALIRGYDKKMKTVMELIGKKSTGSR